MDGRRGFEEVSGRGDLSPFDRSIDEVFRRLGLPDPVLMSGIIESWDELAGDPWKGRSKPLIIEERTLFVEAASPSLVAFLRYGSTDLLERLAERFGAGVIDKIEVRPPS
jgi:hypothetical protein